MRTIKKPLRRYVPASRAEDKPLVMTVHPDGRIEIRPRHGRRHHTVSYNIATLYNKGLGNLFLA